MVYLKNLPADPEILKHLLRASESSEFHRQPFFVSWADYRLKRYVRNIEKGRETTDSRATSYASFGAHTVASIFGEGSEYTPVDPLTRSYLEDLKAFPVNSLMITEGIAGRYRDVPFLCGDVYSYHTESNGKNTYTVTDFRGTIFQFHSNREAKTRVVVKSKPLISLLNKDKVSTESIEFDQTFSVTSQDREGALYILSPKVMLQWLDLEKRIGTDIWAEYREDTLTLVLPGTTYRITGKKLFGKPTKRFTRMATGFTVPKTVTDTLNLDVPLLEGEQSSPEEWISARKKATCPYDTIWFS